MKCREKYKTSPHVKEKSKETRRLISGTLIPAQTKRTPHPYHLNHAPKKKTCRRSGPKISEIITPDKVGFKEIKKKNTQNPLSKKKRKSETNEIK